MNHIEKTCHKAFNILKKNHDYVGFLIKARSAAEQITKEIFKEINPDKPTRGMNFDKIISKLEHKELIPAKIIPHFRMVQTFGNNAIHGKIDNSDIDSKYVEPIKKSLIIIKEWFSERTRESYEKNKKVYDLQNGALESTTINSNYYYDLDLFNSSGFEIKNLLNHKNVLIIVGSNLDAELLSRPVAGILKDEIEKKFLVRAIILSDKFYLEHDEIKKLNLISIGTSEDNLMTRKLSEFGKTIKDGKLYECFSHVGGGSKIALWGASHWNTQVKVENFMADPKGLDRFIKGFMSHHEYFN